MAPRSPRLRGASCLGIGWLRNPFRTLRVQELPSRRASLASGEQLPRTHTLQRKKSPPPASLLVLMNLCQFQLRASLANTLANM